MEAAHVLGQEVSRMNVKVSQKLQGWRHQSLGNSSKQGGKVQEPTAYRLPGAMEKAKHRGAHL